MNSLARFVLLAGALAALSFTPALAHDVDGPDCGVSREDFGDAPEGVLAYPGVIGAFPTCMSPGPVGTREITCPALSPMPGPAGFVRHFLTGDNFWLGCFTPGALSGVDGEPDGKTNQPGLGFSACSPVPTDCIEAAYGLTFDQDECTADGSDAGVTPPTLVVCERTSVTYTTSSCSQSPQSARLNILIDFNHDGDWNDNEQCATGCAWEWAVKNEPITISPGCETHTSQMFQVGTTAGPAWMRVTISQNPVPDNFPWQGTASVGGLNNGETEDYPLFVQVPTPARPASWGLLKSIYRG
jgi:hypothetical protein